MPGEKGFSTLFVKNLYFQGVAKRGPKNKVPIIDENSVEEAFWYCDEAMFSVQCGFTLQSNNSVLCGPCHIVL